MPRLRLGFGSVLAWFWVDLAEKCGNASGFSVAGILVTKGGCPDACFVLGGLPRFVRETQSTPRYPDKS